MCSFLFFLAIPFPLYFFASFPPISLCLAFLRQPERKLHGVREKTTNANRHIVQTTPSLARRHLEPRVACLHTTTPESPRHAPSRAKHVLSLRQAVLRLARGMLPQAQGVLLLVQGTLPLAQGMLPLAQGMVLLAQACSFSRNACSVSRKACYLSRMACSFSGKASVPARRA